MNHSLDTKAFNELGIIALKGFIPRTLITSAQQSVILELERQKLKVGGKLIAHKIKDLPIFQQTGRLGQMVGQLNEVNRLFTEELKKAMNDLSGTKLKSAHPQILLSFPHKEEWSVSHLNWHLDLAVPDHDQISGVQAFILIDEVQEKGGATLALAGSHKLHYLSEKRNAHDLLKISDFAQSPEKYLKPQMIEGVKTQIIEMSGRAGDVYLMDLRVLHTPSINAQKKIRMMATNRYLR